ncbi:RHS repeat-associated core domain-containing protein [Aquimarina longa]|uniref:RHS repeat-associated core domain-containing protein n=1 Tax=Aquimarina longa TaxID=1080221 RepID=UPI000782051A|nr:RHS repeat-associated core domain-containing protein [Aquimarina longa]
MYAGNYVYKNGNLEFFNHPEGYVEKEADGYKYVYQFKDHLGNIRLSYKDANDDKSITQDEIIEEKNYYPFGLKHEGYNSAVSSHGNSTAQKFGYNGIEHEQALGLDLYEMPLRQYDPAIGRWTAIDPITHHSMSTYTAFDNNPVFWADPSGANSTAEWMEENGITDNDLITVYSADDYGPDNNVTVNSKTKKAEISENDNDYDTVVTDGEVSYAPKGSSRSYLESQGYIVKDLEGVGMGAVDNAILILSSEAVLAWVGRGISAWWAGRAASSIDDVSGIVLQRSEQLSILGGNAGKWPWKRTTASIAELTAGGGNCLACARKIQEAIGGRIINIVDNFGAPGIGPMYNKAGKLISRDFKIHHAVRKGDMIFDRVTGPSGMSVDNYKKLFEYGKYLNFK